ncbi:DUF485 domain-containing protein [Streptomyces corynorhini]|uniref:DUF485 domain-containing protein n=1 Tax=Streptomyces corynorhini TaxID=2282652 RepID=A0A370BE74_9ACTN|nr:DUF485 domain-containing protein [Streptomyces corynorhini]RDG40068.1 DUF485 domain-containing protein [Streptomyces corynorhini]
MEKQEGRAAEAVRLDDPWYDALASEWGDPGGSGGTDVPAAPPGSAPRPAGGAAYDIYREVQRGAAFQEVRRRYRRFVVPATIAFLVWYLAYVVAATTAPGLMARPVAGAVNVAMVAGLGQFLSTFLLTWAYARHARLHRDREALELRWTVFDRQQSRERDQERDQKRDQEQSQERDQERDQEQSQERDQGRDQVQSQERSREQPRERLDQRRPDERARRPAEEAAR